MIGKVILGLFLAVLAAVLRGYHQKRKTQVDMIHSLMDKAELVLDALVDDIKSVDVKYEKKYPLAKNLKYNNNQQKLYYSYLERKRLISVAKEISLRKIFEEIKRQDPRLYSIPSSKLSSLKKSTGDFYDDPSKPQSLAKVIHCKNELLYSFNRQPFIWVSYFS